MQIARREWFFDFYGPRLYAMVLGQLPAIIALFLGVTDLHLLAKLLSLGLLALPTAFYHIALTRVRHDPVLLAAVMAVIGVVFMTTSFFIVGEYNTAFAVVIAVTVRLMTAERLTVTDGAFLFAAGVLSFRTYEVMIYCGPLVALMIAWCIRRAPERPRFATTLHILATLLFLGGTVVAADSLIYPFSQDHLSKTAATVLNAWQNVQFDLTLLAALVIVIWAIVRPADLSTPKPYLFAAFFLVLLVFSPLLMLTDTLVRPHAKSQYVARSMAGLVVATIAVLIWIYKSPLADRIAAFRELRRPEAARRLMGFGLLMVLAVVPTDAFLTLEWRNYLQTVRTIVREQSGVIAYENTPLAKPPLDLLVEPWILPSQSLVLRSKRGDGIIAPPNNFDSWQPFPPAKPYPLGPFIWRD
ncbi:MAG: hypothetical protein EPO50_20425 [Reyranella sp.]|nr:MAG: hypothetical protein EPO50_20425 [Reyranella sp.]